MPAFDAYLVREEDGTSLFLLEDGSGSILLETALPTSSSPQVMLPMGLGKIRI